MKTLLALLLALPLAAAPADQPAPRTDKNSQLAHEQLLAKAKQGKIDVYFLGDSITRRWGATDYPQFLEHWTKNFHGWNAANFGWGADRIENILWRVENGELDGVNPKVVVLLAGTNNVGNKPPADLNAAVADITAGMRALIAAVEKRAPKAVILLTAIFPRNDNMEVLPVINGVNANLAKMAGGKRIRFININDKLADANGKLREGVTVDNLHLSLTGYGIWADALKPELRKILGKPKKNDQAPPPTGDPSAAKPPAAKP